MDVDALLEALSTETNAPVIIAQCLGEGAVGSPKCLPGSLPTP